MTSMTGSSVTMAADSSTTKGETLTSVGGATTETASQRRANKRKKVLQERRARKQRRNQGKKSKGVSRLRSHQRDDSASDCDSDLDLRKDLKPIGLYVHHREEMLEHLFRSISTKKLRAMLPESCKGLNLDELKVLCLEQLDVMSRKRILRILDGADPDVISSTDTDEDSSDPDQELAEDHEEEHEEDEGGAVQAAQQAAPESSAGESRQSDVTNPPDESQSQYIDSTSLQEDRYSECSASGAASPRSFSSEQDVSGSGLEYEEDGEVPDRQESLPVPRPDLRQGEAQEAGTVEESREVQVPGDGEQKPGSEEPEEGEVEDDPDSALEEAGKGQEEGILLGEDRRDVADPVEVPSEGSDALQLDVSQADIEGLCDIDPDSPEEGEVVADPHDPVISPPKWRSQRVAVHQATQSMTIGSSSTSQESATPQAQPPDGVSKVAGGKEDEVVGVPSGDACKEVQTSQRSIRRWRREGAPRQAATVTSTLDKPRDVPPAEAAVHMQERSVKLHAVPEMVPEASRSVLAAGGMMGRVIAAAKAAPVAQPSKGSERVIRPEANPRPTGGRVVLTRPAVATAVRPGMGVPEPRAVVPPAPADPPKNRISLVRRHVLNPTTSAVMASEPRPAEQQTSTRVVICETPPEPAPRKVRLRSAPSGVAAGSAVEPSVSRTVIEKQPRRMPLRRPLSTDPIAASPAETRVILQAPAKRAGIPPGTTGSGLGVEAPRRKVVKRAVQPPGASARDEATGGPGGQGADSGGMLSENQMEILELEMRARAIKAMLNAANPKLQPKK